MSVSLYQKMQETMFVSPGQAGGAGLNTTSSSQIQPTPAAMSASAYAVGSELSSYASSIRSCSECVFFVGSVLFGVTSFILLIVGSYSNEKEQFPIYMAAAGAGGACILSIVITCCIHCNQKK